MAVLSPALPAAPPAGTVFDRSGVSWGRVGFVVLLGMFHNELFAVLLNQDVVLLRQAGAALVTGGAVASALYLAWRGTLFHHPFAAWPVVLLAVLIVTSLFANTAFYPKPLSHWLPAHYIYLPILQFYIVMALRTTDKEVVWGLIITGVIAALLMLAYVLGLYDALRYYARRSIFGVDVSRIVIMKYEFFFASLALFAVLLTAHLSHAWKVAAAVLLALCLYLQVDIVQSRQGLVAMGVGMAVLLLVDRRTFQMRPFLVRGAVALVGLMAAPVILGQYLELLGRRDLLHSDELNVAVRFHTFDHYAAHFLETHGVGFGMAAPSSRINNVIAEARALSVNFTDLGLYGAFFQFGVVGGAIAVWLTIQVVLWGLRAARRSPEGDRWRPAVVAAYFIGWLCVPVQINAFTLPSSIHFGALALYLAWYYRARVLWEGRA